MRHHTKDKGDQGLGFVIADCLQHGIQMALPLSEHLPFDCIAIDEEGKLCRIQVKYRKVNKNGQIVFRLVSCWADRHGVHVKNHDRTQYDGFAIYCPDTQECYYIREDEIPKRTVTLRLGQPGNNQTKGVRFAKNYKDPHRLFKNTVHF